jgi:hypothetical protein
MDSILALPLILLEGCIHFLMEISHDIFLMCTLWHQETIIRDSILALKNHYTTRILNLKNCVGIMAFGNITSHNS